jgi:2'-5' RNA ligase
MSKKRRIFVAINLPEDIKRRLFDFQKKMEQLPVRWTKKSSLHLTIVFIGYADEQEIYEVCRMTKEAAERNEAFDIHFEKILYGPPGKPPRMIWLAGKFSDELARIKNELEQTFVSSDSLRDFRPENRPITPHITLARMNLEARYQLPQLEEDFKAVMPVTTIDVMESDLKRDGAEYTILESCPLGEN